MIEYDFYGRKASEVDLFEALKIMYDHIVELEKKVDSLERIRKPKDGDTV